MRGYKERKSDSGYDFHARARKEEHEHRSRETRQHTGALPAEQREFGSEGCEGGAGDASSGGDGEDAKESGYGHGALGGSFGREVEGEEGVEEVVAEPGDGPDEHDEGGGEGHFGGAEEAVDFVEAGDGEAGCEGRVWIWGFGVFGGRGGWVEELSVDGAERVEGQPGGILVGGGDVLHD